MSSNKQYGLIVNKKSNSALSKNNVFGQSDSENSDEGGSTDWIKKSLQRGSENIHMKREAKITMKKALEEDSTVFQYDEVYEQMEQKKTESQPNKEKEKKPKYIEKLLQTSEKRKRENERRIERQVQKEREAEGEQFKDKESFVTTGYKKKLEEFAKLDEEERRQDMLEEIGDVTKQQDISGFYRHLYQSTVSKDNKEKNTIGNIKESDAAIKSPESKNKDKADSRGTSDYRKKDNRNYRKRKHSESSEGQIDADTSSASSSSSSGSSSESDSDIPLEKDVDTKKLRKSPPPKKSKSPPSKKSKPGKESLKKDETESKTVKKTDSPQKSRSSKEKEKIDSKIIQNEDKSPKKSMPDVSIWQKRTVGPVYEAALKRYYERKATREANKCRG